VSGSGISWVVCKSAPRSRQITTPAPNHSVFTGLCLPPNRQRQSTEGTHTYMHTYCISATQSTYIRLEEKYSLESTDPRESEIPPAAAGAGHRRWPRRGPGPAGQDVALRAAGQAVACGPPRLALHCAKTLTYLRRAYVSVYRYSLEVFPVSSLE